MSELNYAYYAKRAEAAGMLAAKATDPSVRAIHERMARDYAKLAELTGAVPLRIVD